MKIWDTARHNLGLKALSLFLAIVLWLFVASGRETETSISVPLVMENIPAGLVVAGNHPSVMDIRIKGPRILVLKCRAEFRSLRLDLAGSREGITAFPSPGAMFNLPEGVSVTRVTPAAIEIRLVKAGRRDIGK